MIQFNVDHTPPEWPTILQHVQAGETVQVLRGQHLVAIIHAPDDLQGWPLQSSTQLARSVFSDWNPPHAPR